MNVLRWLRTVLRLAPRQVTARVRHELWLRNRKRRGWGAPDQEVRMSKVRLPPPAPEDRERWRFVANLWQSGAVEYLGATGSAADWFCAGREKLWRYERHYHAELPALAAMALEDPAGPWLASGRELLEGWAADMPPERRDAWEPYPTSRRILNWAEAAALEPKLTPAMAPRLAIQLAHLRRHVEHHLRGNHLLCNAAALVAGGSMLLGPGSAEAIREGTRLLERELQRQVLPDGGYAERSVLYHALVLKDCLLALALARERGLPPAIKKPLQRMALWLSRLRRADGSYPLLNDTVPQASALAQDAVRRAVRLQLLDRPAAPEALVSLPDTGWTLLREGGSELVFDHGPIGPQEQPGHGHADALGYELNWLGTPVVTDTGVTTYEPGAVRDFERSSAAHATLTVDGRSSDETWKSFRVGSRAKVELLPQLPADRRTRILRGLARRAGGHLHERTLFYWPGRALVVFDRLSGARKGAEIIDRIPLDPSWSAAEVGNVFFLLGPGARGLQLHALRGAIAGQPRGQETPREGWASLGFGKPVPRTSVLLRADARGLCTYAFLAPGVSIRLSETSCTVRGPGAEASLPLEEGMPG